MLLILVVLFHCLNAKAQRHLIDMNGLAHENFRKCNLSESILYFDSLSQSPYVFNLGFPVIIRKATEGDKNAIELLKIYSQSELTSVALINPIHTYIKIRETSDKTDLQTLSDSLFENIKSSTDTNTYTALFNTASFFELRSRIEISPKEQEYWHEYLSNQNRITSTYKFKKVASLKKYLDLLFSYELFKLDYLSPYAVLGMNITPNELNDLRHFQIIEEYPDDFMPMLEIKKSIIELEFERGQSERTLEYAAQLVSSYPNQDNLGWLRELYFLDIPFENYWMKQSHNYWPRFEGSSKIDSFINDQVTAYQWIVMDVWGTWCRPCVKELPLWSEMNDEFKKIENEPIKFITLSYSSKDLKAFMTSNNYTFPVIEVNKQDMKDIDVSSYPTTFLISPRRQFLILPFSTDKVEMIQTFTLIDW